MAGDKQLKKDGQRKDKKVQARKQDFEQPVVGADSPQRGQDTSNFSEDSSDLEDSSDTPDRTHNKAQEEP
jgi:hypothetical protein